ncbi:MAG: peptidoglycan-binding protein [Candidatus Niyogibacteria bacterium]|nr:peptidoglycan-binding protein [Candidatus Niyogibacteria bacterium]
MSISKKRVVSTLLTAATTLMLSGAIMIAPAALAYDFARGLTVGSTGADVMALQQYLNGAGFQVAASGAGSPGSESTYFGAKTKAAVAKWQAANGVTPSVGYFGSISKAKYVALTGGQTTTTTLPAGCTSTAGYSSTTGAKCDGGTTVAVGSGLTVAAGIQPANNLAVQNATRFPFTVVKFTASADKDVTIDSLTIERTGLANDAAFSGVVLTDENGTQLGIAKTLNSLHQATLTEDFVVKAGQTRTMTIAANLASDNSTRAGQVGSFSLVSVAANATVNGTLPIVGASHTINATLTVGTVTMQRGPLDPGAGVTKEVGSTGYTFSSVKVTAGSAEDVLLKSIRWNQTGSIGASDLANLKTYVDGTAYDVVASADGKYFTSSFGAGITILKGFSSEISIKGDIVSGSGRTIDFDIAKKTDVNVVGKLYGYGITPPATGTGSVTITATSNSSFTNSEDPWYAAARVTVSAGTMNLSVSNTVAAQNIAVNLANQPMGAFTVDVRGEAIAVGSQVFTVTASAGGATSTSISLYDENGKVVAGPVDGVATGSALNFTVTFSDSVTFPTGTHVYTLKGKMPSGVANNTTYVAALTSFSSVIGQTTGNTITPTPTTLAALATMTVKSGALAISVSSVPIAQNVIAGSQSFVFANYILDATASGEDIRITSIPLAYDAPGATATELSNCQLYDGSTSVTSGSNVKNPSAVSSSTSFTFDGAGLTVPKGTSKTLAAKCNVSGGVSAGAYTWGLQDNSSTFTGATGVTSGSTISETMTASLGQRMTVSTGGTLSATLDTNSPGYIIVNSGATGVTLAKIRFSATNEDINLKQVALRLSSVATNTPIDLVNRKVTLWDGSTQVGEATFPTGDTATSSAISNFTVPRDSYKVLTVKGDIAAISNSGPLTASGDLLVVDYDGANNGLNGNYGTGVSSGSTRNGSGSTTSSSGVRIMKAYPTVAKLSIASNLLQTGSDRSLYRFSVTANGGDIALYKLRFTVSSSSVTATTSAYSLYAYTDSSFSTADTTFSSTGILNANSYYNGCGAASGGAACKPSSVQIFMNKASATTTYIVASGATRYFELRATVSSVETGTGTEYITAQLEGDAAYPVNQASTYGAMDTAGGVNGDTNADFIWSPISTTTSNAIADVDYTNGYSIVGLPGTNMSAETLTSAN